MGKCFFMRKHWRIRIKLEVHNFNKCFSKANDFETKHISHPSRSSPRLNLSLTARQKCFFSIITRFVHVIALQTARESLWHNGWSTGLRPWSKQVCVPVALLDSLLYKYHLERHETPYSPSYELNNITAVLLQVWLRYYIIQKVFYAIKQRTQFTEEIQVVFLLFVMWIIFKNANNF